MSDQFPPGVVDVVARAMCEDAGWNNWSGTEGLWRSRAIAALRALTALGYRCVPEGHAVVPREAPSAQEVRLHLGEVSAQGMRDICAYHRWLASVDADETP